MQYIFLIEENIIINLVIVTNNDKRTVEKDGYKIDVVPISEFWRYVCPNI